MYIWQINFIVVIRGALYSCFIELCAMFCFIIFLSKALISICLYFLQTEKRRTNKKQLASVRGHFERTMLNDRIGITTLLLEFK